MALRPTANLKHMLAELVQPLLATIKHSSETDQHKTKAVSFGQFSVVWSRKILLKTGFFSFPDAALVAQRHEPGTGRVPGKLQRGRRSKQSS